MALPNEKARAAAGMILRLLSDRDYKALSGLTAQGPDHLRAEEIQRAVESYPGTIRMPAEWELTVDVIEVENSLPRRFSVDVPVFTMEEGRSDLTARITVVDNPGDQFDIIFHDVWVM